MYNSQNESYAVANSKVCQSCGNVTVLFEDTALEKKKGITYAVLGWLFAAVSFLFIPILFGVLGVAMGFITYQERSQIHGAMIILFSSAGLILGSLLSFMVAGTMFL